MSLEYYHCDCPWADYDWSNVEKSLTKEEFQKIENNWSVITIDVTTGVIIVGRGEIDV